MHATIELFLHYGYLLVFLWVMLEQLGVPLPSAPILLTAGTLTATHAMHLHWIILAALAGAAVGDSVWFRLGNSYGSAVTRWICKFSLEATSCVRKTEDMLTRHGSAGLLIAKFVPGLNTMAAPLAGQSKMSYRLFFLYDMAGTFLWATSFVLGGRFFGDAIRRNGMLLHWLSRSAVALVVLVVVGLFILRIVRQQLFLRKIRTLRIEPGELLARNAEIPRDRDVVLYCTCPSEATSARIALAIHRFGVDRIRPLRGGFDGWKEHGYPLVEIPGSILQ